MTLYKCVTSLVGVKRPYCLVGMLKMRREQRYSINCVFGTDYKRKKHYLEQKAHMATRKLRKRQSKSSMHYFDTTRKASMLTRIA